MCDEAQYICLLVDLLDEEIETLKALIGSYDQKIALLEQKKVPKDTPTSVNAAGKRVRADEVKIKHEDPLSYYQYRLDMEIPEQSSSLVAQNKTSPPALTDMPFLRNWHEKVELIFSEEVRCYRFISVKSVQKTSQGQSVMMVVAAALPGGKVQLMDIYGNFLVEFATEDGDEIIDLHSNPRGATSQDDLYVAALTESGAFYVF